MRGKVNQSRGTERMKSRRNKVYIVWICIHLACLSSHTGAVGLYTQFKVHSTITLLTDIHPEIYIEQWSSGLYLVSIPDQLLVSSPMLPRQYCGSPPILYHLGNEFVLFAL